MADIITQIEVIIGSSHYSVFRKPCLYAIFKKNLS